MDDPVGAAALSSQEDNVGFAFAASLASSSATVLGSMLPFVVNIRDTRWLGRSLAFSAGVMVYVSLVEIYKEGCRKFQEASELDGWDLMNPTLASTLSVFLGVLSAAALDAFVHRIHPDDDDDDAPVDLAAFAAYQTAGAAAAAGGGGGAAAAATGGPAGPGAAPAAAAKDGQVRIIVEGETGAACNSSLLPEKCKTNAESDRKLTRMTLLAGLAMAIHNIPEGLVTFVTSIDSVELGVTICIAMAIHNIPEGIIVAIPVCYATGSRWKAFVWGALAGLTEPLGAVLGYVIFRLSSVQQADGHKTLSKTVLGFMLNLVAGMLVFVTFVELLPTAHRYSSSSKTAACCIFAGMFVMALSEVVRSMCS